MSEQAFWPAYTEEEVEAVASVLRSNRVNYWTGDECRNFEREFASWCGTRHAIALANGTVALDLALKGLGIGEGDEVIVTPRSFIASVSCVVNAGARPVFADVSLESGNITPATAARVLTDRTRAIMPVHLAGWPCDMAGFNDVAAEHSLSIIEDCAQAHGAEIEGRSVGSFGTVGCWSFCQDKIMTTGGEGGMVTTNDADLWSSMWSFKDHGKSWSAVYEADHPPGFRWLHEQFGTNWRMLEVQATIGRIQLRRMNEWRLRRTFVADSFRRTLEEFPSIVRTPIPEENLTHAHYRLYGYVRPEGLARGWNRDRIVEEGRRRGIPMMQGSCSEIYLERAFDSSDLRPSSRLPIARELGETSLAFLCHPTMSNSEVAQYCENLSEVLNAAMR